MLKAAFIQHPRDTRDLSTVELEAQTATAVVALDRRWCSSTPVTLHIEENPLTHKIKVRHLDTKEPFLEIRRIDSTLGDLFHMVEVATEAVVATVFGRRGRIDVFSGLHELDENDENERVPGLLTIAVTTTGTTMQFQDAELRRPSRATVDGGLRDRVALLSVHHGVSWHPVARINRPEHALFKLPYFTVEIAPGVDMMLPLVMWLSRWATYELQQRVGARPTSGQMWGQPNPGTSR